MINQRSAFVLQSCVGLEASDQDTAPIASADRLILRDLAQRVAELAALPIMAERRALWVRHNQLQPVRPMLLVFPEGSWRELLPASTLQCGGQRAREIEWTLRSLLYYHAHIHDDTVIESSWVVSKRVSHSGWGLEPRRKPSAQSDGAYGFLPVIHSPDDLSKLVFPRVMVDEPATAAELSQAQELFGDILDVQLVGVSQVSFHLMSLYTSLRGLEQVMWDMLDNPAMLHEAMAFLEEGHRGLVQQYQELNLLSLNNGGNYQSSGGVSYTTELPRPGYDPAHVRLCDLWASAEAQEMAQVSPRMHAEFILPYERRLLEPFGLTGYGCCEDLTNKLQDVFSIPNLRRISISPWADVDRCAEQLGNKYIFSWKPQPAHLVGRFDADMVRGYIQHTLDVAKDCVLEIVLKDTHTCEQHPERFDQWTAIAQELVKGC